MLAALKWTTWTLRIMNGIFTSFGSFIFPATDYKRDMKSKQPSTATLKVIFVKYLKYSIIFLPLGIFRAFSIARCDQLSHWTTRSCLKLLCAEIFLFKAGRDGVCL